MPALSFVLAITSCSTPAEIPNVPVCLPEDYDDGICEYTMDRKMIEINNSNKLYQGMTWSELLERSLVIPASSWAAIKVYILEQCAKEPSCRDKLSPKQ